MKCLLQTAITQLLVACLLGILQRTQANTWLRLRAALFRHQAGFVWLQGRKGCSRKSVCHQKNTQVIDNHFIGPS